MTTPNKFALFDIDYTLTRGGGTTFIEGHRVALREVLEVDLPADFDLTPHEGKTAAGFFVDVAEELGVEREKTIKNLGSLETTLTKFCLKHADELGVVPMPGVEKCLGAMQEEGVGLGILTGNFKGIAHLKLRLGGIDDYFSFGAYGDVSENRVDLVTAAEREASEVYGTFVRRDQFFIVGDSWRDMQCAREAGIGAIGVVTGPNNVEDLDEAGADLVIPTLESYRAIINFTRGPENAYSRNERRN